ncbi:MAG: hypothetical protein M5R36_13850 [Deltaproteobacteria bacterium]|nr:hypothetical protein [Deltaproteobacteria bacterium]
MGFWRPSAGPTARRPFLGAWLFGLALAVVLVAATVHAQDAAETAADLTSLTLEQAIGIGLSAGEEPQIAREEINRADAVVTEHYSAVFPHLTGISGYTYNIERPVQKVDFSGFNPLLAELNLPPMEPAGNTARLPARMGVRPARNAESRDVRTHR